MGTNEMWAQMKKYTRAHCNYSIGSLRRNIPAAFDSISNENINNEMKHFMFCYLEGLIPGKELDQRLKKYKTAVKSKLTLLSSVNFFL